MKSLIVKLFTSSREFSAIRYNMDKVNLAEAELLAMENMDLLAGYPYLRTADLEHYFGAIASLNARSHFDQFHAVISCRGEGLDKSSFLEISTQWLSAMGYSEQPYLIFLHKDTNNRHVHIVSTDVRLDGSKISDSFDRTRAITELNKICGLDEDRLFKEDISRLLNYRCGSTAQLKILFNKKGYHFFQYNAYFLVRKYGKTLLRIDAEALIKRLQNSDIDLKRTAAVKLIIEQAMLIHSGRTEPIYQYGPNGSWKRITGFRSDLADFILSVYSLEISYLFSRKKITGFLVIDHHNAQLMDGGVVMELERFISSGRIQTTSQTAIVQR